jgi:PAS domain-containing protein
MSLPSGHSPVPEDAPGHATRKARNNVRNRHRVAVVKETMDELREELERQGVMEPIAPDIVAAGGRRMDMAAPKAKILSAALQQLVDLKAENERLRQLALARNVTPLSLVMPPPDVSGACVPQSNFVLWAFQQSGVPCFVLYVDEVGKDSIVACNRSFRDLLGWPRTTGRAKPAAFPAAKTSDGMTLRTPIIT